MPPRTVLRDFIYLDWERTRSIAAQLFRGVPTDTSREEGSEATAGASIEGGVLPVLRGRASGDYRFFRSESETHSLHHHVYSMVEERLNSEGLIVSVDSNFDYGNWDREFFPDGQFVRISGLVRLIDYGWLASMMDGLPKLMRAAQHGTLLTLKQGAATQQEIAAKRREQERELDGLKELKIEQMTELVRNLYGDVVRVKLLPNKRDADKIFLASAPIENFYDKASSLSQKYGYEIDADWIALGQVNMPASSDVPQPMPIGNPIEDSFEQLALSATEIMRMASSVQFPRISLTLISLYRILS